MTKSTSTYWNALSPENQKRWTSIQGLEGMVEELTLSIDYSKSLHISRPLSMRKSYIIKHVR